MSSGTIDQADLAVDHASAWQLWGLLKQELLFLCWAFMDVSIIAPIGLVVMRWTRFWDIGQLTLLLLLFILLPFNIVRFLSALQVPRKYQWRILLIALILTLLAAWRGLLYAPQPLFDLSWLNEFASHLGELQDPLWARDLAIFLFTLVGWWRGLRLAQMSPDIYRIGLRLRAGVLLLAPLALILHASGRLWAAMPFILLYFLAGLTAVALIRAEQIEREHSGFAASLTPRWVATVALTSLLVVATAALFAVIISGEAMTLFSGRLAAFWTAAVATLAVSLSTVIFLFTPFINLIISGVDWLANLFSTLFAGMQIGLDPNTLGNLDALQPFNFVVREEGLANLNLPPAISRILVGGIMLIVAAVITLILTRMFRQPQTTEPPETILIHEGALEDNASLAERLLQRLGFTRRWRTAASIRRIYGQMCHLAAESGYPRSMAQTPYEYLSTLQQLWPENQSDYQLITEAYIRVRYGEIPETAAELETIKAAWQQLTAVETKSAAAPTLTTVSRQ